MLEVYIDGDACPVKEEVLRVAERHALTVHLVSNQWLRVPDRPRLNKVLVPGGANVADDWIAERIGPGDIVVTGDIPLAARCIDRGARALDHGGRPFAEASIGMTLAMRDLMAGLRETGEATTYNAAFTKRDRSRLLEALETTIQAIRRQGK
ncbi:MAG: YaiI/YqxD family protein [Alphaproteobacteria bacterium]